MRGNFHLTDQAKDRLGHVAVAAMLLVAVLLTGCGRSDVPESRATVASHDTPTEPIRSSDSSRRPEPVVTTVTPTPDSVTDEDTKTELVARGPITYEEAEKVFFERRYDEAKQLFASYVEHRPDNPWGQYMLGLSAWKSGDYELAERAFDRTLEQDPTHVKSLRNLSRVFLETARPEDAVEQLQTAQKLDPTSGETHRLLGRAYEQLGKRDDAVESYHRAIVLDEEDAWSMNNLGLILIREERFDEALLPLARAVQLADNVAVFQNNLGMALERTGHNTKSAEAYRAALSIDGSYAKAEVNLQRVDGKPDVSGAGPVELTVLAENFVELVRSWRAGVTTDETVGPEFDRATPPAVEEQTGDEPEVPTEEVEPEASPVVDSLKVDELRVKTNTITTAHSDR